MWDSGGREGWIVLVSYCYITSYHKLSNLKQHALCHSFSGSRFWAWLYAGSHKATIKVSAGAVVSSDI